MKKYFDILSKKCLLIAGTLLLMFSSCDESVLDEVPLDFLAPENAYTTVAGVRQGISGLHWTFRNYWFWGDQDQGSMWRGVGTDVAFHGEDPNSTRFLCNYVNYLIPASNYVLQYWTRNYELIQRANVLIDRIDNSDPAMWASEAQKNAFKAEAMFFRAYAYRILVSYFGDVPLVTEVIKTAKVDFVRAPKSEVYKQMEDDLIYAGANLPGRMQEEAPGRITKAAALSVLSEIYLEQGKHQLAVDAATSVITGAGYALMTDRFGAQFDVFGTGDAYYDLFRYGNQNLGENTENIWSVQFEPLVPGGGDWQGERGMGPAYFRWGNAPDGVKAFRGEFVNGVYTGYSDTLGRPVSWVRPTTYVTHHIWADNWDTDIRNAKHSIKRDFYYDNPASVWDKQKLEFSQFAANYAAGTRDPVRDSCQYIFPYFMKFAEPCNHFDRAHQSGGGYSHKDVYVIRLAETILLRAEAYLGLGRKDLAAADINLVRNRAQATPVEEDDVTIEYILDERARELYGEEWRHITLRRVGLLVQRVLALNDNPKNPGLNIQNYHVLWPIPLSQIDLNIDAVIPQNPGY
ncbi:MAG: RagB/SusD family nutrient uptake outer membrane protein [Bacteroidales bacterium]